MFGYNVWRPEVNKRGYGMELHKVPTKIEKLLYKTGQMIKEYCLRIRPHRNHKGTETNKTYRNYRKM